MNLSRREFLKAAAAATVLTVELTKVEKALAGNGDTPVIWLQGSGCTGCSVSFLNSIYYATADDLLLNTLSVEYHPNVSAAAGDFAISAASLARPSPAEIAQISREWLGNSNLQMDLNSDSKTNWLDYALLAKRGYVLVVEGAIPTGSDGLFCTVGTNMTMLAALQKFSQYAGAIIAVGTCASYGGVSAAAPNNSSAKGVKDALAYLGISKSVINIPGCPFHPDWLVGTISYILVNGTVPPLDANGRPTAYYGSLVHDNCPNLANYNASYAPHISTSHHGWNNTSISCMASSCHQHNRNDGNVPNPRKLGMSGCMWAINCKGKFTHADCPSRKWNSPAAGTPGVNWCIQANAPCHGCTEPNFPDGFEPFYTID
jgi:hydrogenase small subunit